MPPVAHDFWNAVEELLDARTNDIGSARALSMRLHELDQRQSADSWRRSLKRYARGTKPNEETAGLIAKAFGVERASLPDVERLSLVSLDFRLRVLEARAAALEEAVGNRLRELVTQADQAATKEELRQGLETLRAAIDAAANQGTRRSPRKAAKG